MHDYFALMGQTFAARGPRARTAERRRPTPAGSSGGDARGGAAGARRRPAPGTHASTGNARSEIVGFAVSDPHGQPGWTTPSGGTLRFWYLIEAQAPIDDLNVGIHFYDRRGILVFAVGNANRAIALPRLDAGERLCAPSPSPWPLAPGEYTLVPQTGGLTGEVPEVGVLHDRLESLAPRGGDAGGLRGRAALLWAHRPPRRVRVERRRHPTGVSDDV